MFLTVRNTSTIILSCWNVWQRNYGRGFQKYGFLGEKIPFVINRREGRAGWRELLVPGGKGDDLNLSAVRVLRYVCFHNERVLGYCIFLPVSQP